MYAFSTYNDVCVSMTGMKVTLKERRDCELFYLSYIAKTGPTSVQERQREHPRWEELCKSACPQFYCATIVS
jgi:hypothetical protein